MTSANLIARTSTLVEELSSFFVSLQIRFVNQNENWILQCIYKAELT